MQEVDAKMESLPRDVVLDIFSRLPISSFMRVKSVCRTWRAIAQDPGLPSMYHAHLSDRDPSIVVQREDIPCQDHLQLYVIGEKDGCCSYGTKPTRRKIDSKPSSREFYVAGSCNGLICVSDKRYNDSLYVFNPFVSGYIEIPKLVTQNPNQKVALGFGVNPKTRAYKIVRIAYFEKNHTDPKFAYECSDVHVFTIGTRAWRRVEFAPWRLDCRPAEATVNGALHWVTRRYAFEPFHLHIISFDLATERFKEIQRPYKCGHLDIHNYHLVVLRGCLSIAALCNNQIEIWIMKEYNVRESWTKEFTIAASIPVSLGESFGKCTTIHWNKPSLPRGSIQVLCVLKSGEILLEYEGRGLLLYNPAGEDFKEVITNGIPTRFSTMVHYPSPFPVEAILQMQVQVQVNNSFPLNDITNNGRFRQKQLIQGITVE